MTKEQIETGSNLLKRRGRSQESVELIDAMREICEEMQPITGRGIGYKLFSAGLISSMSKNEMARVYRLLRQAREEGTIEWSWIVDETRSMELTSQWRDPEQLLRCAVRQYRLDFWQHQPCRVEVWSEKGTVRGVLQPVLDQYGVGFRVMHGFSGATTVHEVAQDYDGRLLRVIYVGDYDPSGLYMSEVDLPQRIERYGGEHVSIDRVAVTIFDVAGLPSFPASSKRKDPRYDWWIANECGDECWELDAMDPRELRDTVESAISDIIEPEAWARCEVIYAAERVSLEDFLKLWNRRALK